LGLLSKLLALALPLLDLNTPPSEGVNATPTSWDVEQLKMADAYGKGWVDN
jgi:hypothetical protein